MQPEFWHSRWQSNQIGFHQHAVNAYLQRFWPALGVPVGARVLVPLCGKSLDLAWLAAQGHGVLGVELSEKAIQDFFEEQGLAPDVDERGAFKRYRTHDIELWCGDIFALKPEDVAECLGLYDRAALIALPPDMRQRYTAHLGTLLPPGCRGLLVTLDYDQAVVAGPPFAVAQEEAQALLGPRWHLRLEDDQDILAQSPKFLQAGARYLRERTYRLLPLSTL